MIYKCPECGATGPGIIQQCCTSNRVYITHNLETDEWVYECDDIESVEYTMCKVCRSDLSSDDLDTYTIEA